MLDTPLNERQCALLANWLRLKHLPPLGYMHDQTRSRFLLDPTFAPLVRRAFEKVLEGDMPHDVLAHVNDELGFRSPLRGQTGGRPLSRGAFYRLLGDPFYAGRLRSRFGTVPGEHEAIVSEDEFARVREVLGARGRRPARRRRRGA